MLPAALAKFLGLSVNTVRVFPGRTMNFAPARATLAKMRAELVRHAYQTIGGAAIRAKSRPTSPKWRPACIWRNAQSRPSRGKTSHERLPLLYETACQGLLS